MGQIFKIMKRIQLLLIFGFITFTGYCYTGEVIQSFDTPGSYPTGLTFDGENIWMADYLTDLIYCLNPKTGELIRSIPAPAYWDRLSEFLWYR